MTDADTDGAHMVAACTFGDEVTVRPSPDACCSWRSA